MGNRGLGRLVAIGCCCLAIGVVCQAAGASQVTATWNGGTGNWSETAHWTGLPVGASYPSNGTPPGTTYQVRIDSNNSAVSNVSLDVSVAVDVLRVSTGDTFAINNG